MSTRRCFIRSSAVAVAGVGLAPSWLLRAASQETKKKKVLIAIFQRGAADGLNIVVPYFEQTYYDLRPGIAIPAPGSGRPNSAIDLDGRFGLHPQLQVLKPLWDNKQLAIVEAAGSPDPTRSHFDAQDYMEAGIPGNAAGDGWLNRAMQPEPGASTLRAIAVGAQLPRTLRGNWPAVAVSNLDQFKVKDQNAADILQSMYAMTADAKLQASGKETFEAIKMVEAINQKPYTPANGAQYNNDFGRGLEQIARLIKADAGVEAAFADIGSWDHHTNEPGQLSGMLQQYGSALAAFVRDMGDRMEDIVLVTMSEFGRTVKEDGNNGTDHGHGNVMMVIGGSIRGGQVYGRWPGLAPDQLYENRDLAVTTDFRDVLGELVQKHLGQNTDKVFPGYKPGPALGLI